MRWAFIFFRFYPYWAIPVAFVVFELGRHFHRHKSPRQWPLFGMVGVLVLSSILWFVFRGDLNSDSWVRALLFQNR